MIRALFRGTSAPAIAAPVFGTRGLVVRRSKQARGFRLVVDPRDGAVRLTIPARAALKAAYAWAEGHRGWIEAQLASLPGPQPIVPGAAIPFDGGTLRIDWQEGRDRTVRRNGEALVVGGPRDTLAPRVLRWLRAEALRVLTAETAEFAARAGVTVTGVAVGDPRSRWGSCSSAGDIRYAWRLILMPPDVRRATVAHEVAHRLHMDHSPAFHAAVKRLLGRDPKAERAWLKANGAALHWVGRDA